MGCSVGEIWPPNITISYSWPNKSGKNVSAALYFLSKCLYDHNTGYDTSHKFHNGYRLLWQKL